jgi:hypothetical protein
MATGSRLAAFGVILAGTFGTAYAVGERLPGHGHSGSTTDGHSHSHTAAQPTAATTTTRGYQLVAMANSAEGTEVGFRIDGPDGQPVTEYTEAHGALLHAVLIRPDLSGFQHVHPTIGADGTFEVDPGAPGQWRIIFETTPASTDSPIVLSTNLDDETAVAAVPLPAAADEVTIEVQGDTIAVTRSGTNFIVDAPQPLEPYLGQQAHLIAIRNGDLAYTHIHPGDPMTGMLMFSSAITEPGTYRMFLQFGYRGEVVTAAFTVVVS